MTNPSPKKPNKVTHRVSADGRTIECDIDIYEVSNVVPEVWR